MSNDEQLIGIPRKRSTITWLRKLYPTEKWSWVREGFGCVEYYTESGWHAGYRSCLAPTWEGDDETCVSRFYLYRPNTPTLELYP